jgi:hypothetical protein
MLNRQRRSTDIDFTALAAMPALVEESLTYNQAERLISIAAWPCAIIDDAGTSTGFVMPAIPDEFFISLSTAKGVSSSTAEFQHLSNHSTVLAARGITLDNAQRFSLLRETASALAFLHKHGVCVGDISPKNLLFSLTRRTASTSSTATPWRGLCESRRMTASSRPWTRNGTVPSQRGADRAGLAPVQSNCRRRPAKRWPSEPIDRRRRHHPSSCDT